MAHIFITGVTGQVGSFVAKELLSQGHFLSFLVRGPKAQERVQSVFEKMGIVSSNWQAFEGNLFSLPPLKKDIDVLLHSAAELSFDPLQKEKVWHTNLEGTKSLLAWASQCNITSFHYVSTAYIAGHYKGKYSEESLDLGQTFRNEYEKSKLFTERLCHEFCSEKQMNLNIYRPGIIMGAYSGQSLHYQGYYAFLKVLSELYEKYHQKEIPQEEIYSIEDKLHLPIRIQANPYGKKHLVVLDYVAKAISAVLTTPSMLNQTLFLLPKKIPTNQETLEWAQKALGLCGLSLMPSLEGKKLNRIERIIQHYIHIYKSYLEEEPDFDYQISLEKLEALGVVSPILDEGYFRRLIVYGKQDNWGIKKKEEKSKNQEYPCDYSYFIKFLPSFLEKPFLPGKIVSAFGVCLKEDSKGFWKLVLDQGILKTLEYNQKKDDLNFYYTLSYEIFLEIIAGKLDPRYAFFSGKTDISGNIEHGLKVATVLKEFFQKNPWP